MNFSGLIGLMIGVLAIIASVSFNLHSFPLLLQPNAALIVLGGTFGAAVLNFSVKSVLNAFSVAKEVFVTKEDKTCQIISDLLELSYIARRDGLLSLQTVLEDINDSFLKRGIAIAMDISNPQVLHEVLTAEIDFDEEQELINPRIFEALGGYAPTFGIVGAVIGLIDVMSKLQDPSALGNGIATAFVATLYGVGIANLIFLPIAGKLKMLLREKILLKEVILQGIVSIQMGENPAIIEEKLITFLKFHNKQHNKLIERSIR